MVVLTIVLPWIPFKFEGLTTLRWGILLGLLAIISQAIYNSCTIIFQANLSYQKTLIGSVIGNVFFLITTVLILSRSGDLLLLVAMNTLGSFLVSLSALYLVKDFVGPIRLGFDWQLWRRLLSSALPLGLTVFLTVIVAKADSFLLSVVRLPSGLGMSNADALGNYGLAYKIFENILVLPTYFVNSIFPILVIHGQESLTKLRQTTVRSLISLVSLSLLVMIFSLWLSPLAINVLSGQGDGSLAVLALRILSLGLPFFFGSAVLMFFLISSGREGLLPWIYGLAAVFNVVANLVYIPRFGFIASAWITGITELLIFLVLFFASFGHAKILSRQ